MGRIGVLSRMLGWGLAVFVLIGCAAWGLNSRPRHVVWGRFGAGVEGNQVVAAWCSAPLARQGAAWKMGSGGMVVVGPRRVLLPSTTSAVIQVSSTNAPLVVTALDALYVPLVFAMPLLGLIAGALIWMGRRRAAPGHCRGCGYDLRGLGGGRCPECGRGGELGVAAGVG